MNTYSDIRRRRPIANRTRRTNEDFKKLLTRNDQTIDKEVLVEEKGDKDVVDFFRQIFMSRDIINLYHYNVKGEPGSRSLHEACNEYYDDILDLFDALLETYMGEYGVIEGYDMIDKMPFDINSKPAPDYLGELADYIDNARKIFTESHLQSQIDDIMVLIYHIRYKMLQLK